MKYIIYVIIFLIILFNVYSLGKKSVDRTEVIRTDTITKVDTLVIEKPIPDTVYIKEIITDTVYSTDSVLVEVQLPIETKVYTDDSTYIAQISGYKSSLDWVKTFTPTTEIIKEKVIYKDKSKVNVSLSTGYGYGLVHKQSDMFVGVTVSVPIFGF